MSKFANDGLTRSGTGCFIAVTKTTHAARTVGVKGLKCRSAHHIATTPKYYVQQGAESIPPREKLRPIIC